MSRGERWGWRIGCALGYVAAELAVRGAIRLEPSVWRFCERISGRFT